MERPNRTCSNQIWKIAAWSAILQLTLTLGCARQFVPQVTGEGPSGGQQLPFERSGDARGISPTAEFMPAVIPAGTPITVRLHAVLSSALSHAGDYFDAILDEPIVVQGQTFLPQGATITGKVLDAKPSGQLKDPGYLRLVLTAVSLNGKFTPIQTSSIFAKGGARGERNLPLGASITPARKNSTVLPSGQQDVRYDPEQRLTFRLAEPLPLHS